MGQSISISGTLVKSWLLTCPSMIYHHDSDKNHKRNSRSQAICLSLKSSHISLSTSHYSYLKKLLILTFSCIYRKTIFVNDFLIIYEPQQKHFFQGVRGGDRANFYWMMSNRQENSSKTLSWRKCLIGVYWHILRKKRIFRTILTYTNILMYTTDFVSSSFI